MSIETLRLQITNFMNTSIYQNTWFFFNWWSFVHIISGFLVMFIIIKYFRIRSTLTSLLILLLSLSAFEVFEYVIATKSNEVIFRLDPLKDTISDMVYGVTSGVAAFFSMKR